MNIQKMKAAAKAAAKANGTSHQHELNVIASELGHSHWGGLLQRLQGPRWGVRYGACLEDHARDLHHARKNGLHLIYIGDTPAHVLHTLYSAVDTAISLYPTDIAGKRGLIPAPPKTLILNEGGDLNAPGLPRISIRDLNELPADALVVAAKAQPEYLSAASAANVILAGAAKAASFFSWPKAVQSQALVLYVPTQRPGQIAKRYSAEDQKVIFAATRLNYHGHLSGSEESHPKEGDKPLPSPQGISKEVFRRKLS